MKLNLRKMGFFIDAISITGASQMDNHLKNKIVWKSNVHGTTRNDSVVDLEFYQNNCNHKLYSKYGNRNYCILPDRDTNNICFYKVHSANHVIAALIFAFAFEVVAFCVPPPNKKKIVYTCLISVFVLCDLCDIIS